MVADFVADGPGAVGSAPTAEEMDYQYDSRGRLTGAAFAQTPYTGFTPSGSSPWYDSTHPAQSRARAYYTYDAGGRMLNCDHYWDTLVSGTLYYGTSPVRILPFPNSSGGIAEHEWR